MTSPQIRTLARRLDSLERQARQRKLPTLGFSAIDDGALQSVDVDGVLKMIVGKQFDGTQTSAVVSGPTPPQTILPGLTAMPGALRIYWDGTFADGAVAPMDFARVLVYALPLADYVSPQPLDQSIIVGQFTSATGGEISAVLDPSTEYAVYFVAWTQAGKYGPASDVAVATTLAPLRGEPGADGADGLPGTPGDDGESLYTWLKYADDASGTGMADSPIGKTYIGLAYNKATPAESTDPLDYQWALIKGADGIPGQPGDDGQSLYTWVKYADSSAGAGLTDDPTGKDFIGLAYNKTSATESTVPADYTWSRYRGDDEPVVAPSASPEIRVTGTSSALVVEASDIDAGTTIDYHISETDGFAEDSSTLYVSTTSRVTVIQSTADGTVLDPAGTYYLKAVAHNTIGSAAPSAQVTGNLDLNNVDSVVAASLVTGFVLTGQIQVGQILIDADQGISIANAGGGYVLKFPSNGTDPLELTAQIVAQSLNVEDNLSIGGNGQLYGDFQMTNGITNPAGQASLGNYYPSTLMQNAMGDGQTDISNIYHGIIDHPTDANSAVTAVSFFGTGIRMYSKYSGQITAYPDPTSGKSWCTNFYAWGGIAYLSGHYYLFGTDNDRPVSGEFNSRCFLYKIDATTFNKVAELELWDTGVFNEYRPRIAADPDNGKIHIFWMNSQKTLRTRNTTASMSSWSSINDLATLGARRAVADAFYGTVDGIGSPRWWVALDGGTDPVMCWTANASGPNARSATYDFEKATNGLMGLSYDANRGQMISLDRYGNMYRYGKYPTNKSIIGQYAWLDDNATGGTHETMPGPSRTQTIKARGYVNTTVGSPPDLNNDDALNTDKANKVAGYFSDDGGSTWRRRVYQKDRTLSVTTQTGTFGDYVTTTGTFTEQDIGSTISGTGIPTDAKIKNLVSSSQVRMDKMATAAGTITATLTPSNPWSTAYAALTDMPSGTPKGTNEFTTSTVATPGKIRSTAETATAVDGMTEKIHLKGDGQFRMGNYTHVRHHGSRKMTGPQGIPSSVTTTVNFGSEKEPATGLTWDDTNSRWIINKPGVYMVTLMIQWERNLTNRRQAMIYLNGSNFATNESPSASFDSNDANQTVAIAIACNTGDYIDARVWQNSGSTINVNSADSATRHYFTCSFIGT